MRVDYQVQQLYAVMIKDVTTSEAKWKDICQMIGQLYRYEFDNILMIYVQRPHATLVADFDTWKKVNRYVKRGSKGIAIFPSRALKPSMRHVFDISDTGGQNRTLTWSLDDINLEDYLKYVSLDGHILKIEGDEKKYLKEQLKNFTQTDVRDIIKEEFAERMTELIQLTGSVIKELNVETQEPDAKEQSSIVEEIVYKSIMYSVGTRCGFDLSGEEQDFSQIVNFSDEEVVYRLGSLVCDVSCSVLKEFNKNLKDMERQKEASAERRIAYGRSIVNLHGSRRDIIPESGITKGGREEPPKSREIRDDVIELSEGERTSKIQDINEIRTAGSEDARSGRGSESAIGYTDGKVSGEEQAGGSKFHNGDVADKGAGEDAGGRNRSESDRVEISLEKEQRDNEIEKELNEINSFGYQEEAKYHQASFFFVDATSQSSASTQLATARDPHELVYEGMDFSNTQPLKYSYVEPKKELLVPHEYIVNVLKRGTGFEGGKNRVIEIFQNVLEPSERARRIKKEYGLGGAGWPLEGYGLHGYDSFKSNGLRFQWRDEEGEKEGYVSWASIEREIGVLILTGEYQNERIRLDELLMEGDREDLLSGEYKNQITEEEKLSCVREDIKMRDEQLIMAPEFTIIIGKVTYVERVDGGTAMLEAISKCKTGDVYPIGKFKGFELLVEKNYMGINYMLLRGKTEYKVELSTSPVGNMVKLENTFNSLSKG